MSIWTFKARILAIAAACFLAACDEATMASFSGRGAAPLTQVSMSNGAVRLATPQGYCIDRRSLSAQFALIARCDTLGVDGFFGAWELAIVTVSLAPVGPESSTPQISPTREGDKALRTINRGALTLTQFQGTSTEVDGVSDQYWRTAFVLNERLVSLALYAPASSGANGTEGARILTDIVRSTRSVSTAAGG